MSVVESSHSYEALNKSDVDSEAVMNGNVVEHQSSQLDSSEVVLDFSNNDSSAHMSNSDDLKGEQEGGESIRVKEKKTLMVNSSFSGDDESGDTFDTSRTVVTSPRSLSPRNNSKRSVLLPHDDSCGSIGSCATNDTFTSSMTNSMDARKRVLSPKQLSSLGSDSFGTSHTRDSLETFNSSLTSTSNAFDSPTGNFGKDKSGFKTPDSANTHNSPLHAGILREDSFDRKKHHTYKTTYKAEPKLERAKVLGINEYTFLRTLGKGAFAEVKLATKSKLENDDVVRDLNVDHFERYAIKIIKKNFLQEKRKFQSAPLVVEEAKKNSPDPSAAVVPRPSGRSLRMKNKKFQTASSNTPPLASNTTSATAGIANGTNITPNGTTVANISDKVSTSTTPPKSPKHPEPPPVAEEVLQEIEILKYLRHKNLVKLCELIDDPASKFFYIVMEYVPAGPIMVRESTNDDFKSRLTGGVLLESMACNIFKDLMSVLEYLHLNHIAHRDLKPDNLLVDFHGNLKVSDFGVSSHFSEEKRKKAVNMRQLSRSKSRGVVNSTEGTFAFYSPEMCRENAGAYSAYMSDVWAASVCLWIFVFGKLPFYSPDVVDLFSLIRHQEPVKPHRVSPELDHLFGKILQKKQEDRLSVHDIQNHCWLKRIPFRGNGVFSDDFETDDDLDVSIGDIKDKLSPRLYTRILKWANDSRMACANRLQRYMEEMDAELVTMLRRSSIAFKNDDMDDDEGHSSDDDDPLARLVSYDDINGTVLDDIKRHEERHAALQKLASLVEGDEGKSPVQMTPPKPKKKMREGRKSKINLFDDDSNNSLLDSGPRPTLEMHERLTQESIAALELEAFTISTNKQLASTEEEAGSKGLKNCCAIS